MLLYASAFKLKTRKQPRQTLSHRFLYQINWILFKWNLLVCLAHLVLERCLHRMTLNRLIISINIVDRWL